MWNSLYNKVRNKFGIPALVSLVWLFLSRQSGREAKVPFACQPSPVQQRAVGWVYPAPPAARRYRVLIRVLPWRRGRRPAGGRRSTVCSAPASAHRRWRCPAGGGCCREGGSNMAASGAGEPEGWGGLALLGPAPGAPSCPHGERGAEGCAGGTGCGPRRGAELWRAWPRWPRFPVDGSVWHRPERPRRSSPAAVSAPLPGAVFYSSRC